MKKIDFKKDGKTLILFLTGRVDTNNSAELEAEALGIIDSEKPESLVMDCKDLTYISSSGLRILLKLKKTIDDMILINVEMPVYDILQTTGFTEMLKVRRAQRAVSIKDCEVVGKGANGIVYRIDDETIVKAYMDPDSLPEIEHERELARTAFVLGIPTAIPYDVVQIEGGGYGSVFELLDAESLAKLLIGGKKTVNEVTKISTDLLKTIHSTEVPENSMPDMKEIALDWAEFLKDHLDKKDSDKLIRLIKDVPDSSSMIHGDYHIKNVLFQNGEALLIDMDTICHGDPVFEFGSMFNSYIGFGAEDPEEVRKFLGIDPAVCREIWDKSLKLYFKTEDKAVLEAVENKARVIGFARLLRRSIRKAGNKYAQTFKAELLKALEKVDSLKIMSL